MCTGFEIPALFGGAGAAATAGTAALGSGLSLGGGLGLTLGGGSLGLTAASAGAGAIGAGLGTALAGVSTLGGLAALDAGVGAIADYGLSGGGGGLGLTDAGGTFGGGLGAGVGEGLGGAFAADYGLTSAAALGSLGGGTAGAAAASPSIFSTAMKYANPAMSIYSGITGLQKQKELERMARLAAAQSDPWGNSGGRSLADAQLQQLLRDPSAVAENDPAYKLRIQGAQRANAQFGQDSGAMSVAGANASTNWYNERLAQLGALAGSGVNPGTGAQIGLNGQIAANEQASQSLGSIGYGIGQLTGQGGLTPQQQLMLLQQRRSVG